MVGGVEPPIFSCFSKAPICRSKRSFNAKAFFFERCGGIPSPHLPPPIAGQGRLGRFGRIMVFWTMTPFLVEFPTRVRVDYYVSSDDYGCCVRSLQQIHCNPCVRVLPGQQRSLRHVKCAFPPTTCLTFTLVGPQSVHIAVVVPFL